MSAKLLSASSFWRNSYSNGARSLPVPASRTIQSLRGQRSADLGDFFFEGFSTFGDATCGISYWTGVQYVDCWGSAWIWFDQLYSSSHGSKQTSPLIVCDIGVVVGLYMPLTNGSVWAGSNITFCERDTFVVTGHELGSSTGNGTHESRSGWKRPSEPVIIFISWSALTSVINSSALTWLKYGLMSPRVW